jgi:hypothetical protein
VKRVWIKNNFSKALTQIGIFWYSSFNGRVDRLARGEDVRLEVLRHGKQSSKKREPRQLGCHGFNGHDEKNPIRCRT